MNIIKLFLLGLTSLLFCQLSFAQKKQTTWNITSFSNTGFIENNGQFTKRQSVYDQPFVVDNGNAIYFMDGNSITIDIQKISEETLVEIRREKDKEQEMKLRVANGTLSEEEFIKEEKEREAMFANIKKESEVFMMQWVNTNSSDILATDKQYNYYAYGQLDQTTIKANAYDNLNVKSLYENVDIQYSIPEKGGVKYELTLHPGAVLDNIELEWDGIQNLQIDKEGNLIITTKNGEFIDHAPIAYYQDSKKKVKIKYLLEGNTLKFDIAKYDKNKTLIIDPWLVALPVYGTDHYGVHVETDDAGNSYVMSKQDFMSGDEAFIYKYNSSGILEWTYAPSVILSWYGDFKVIKSTGDFFISIGSGVIGNDFERVNTSATLVYASTMSSSESWCIQHNCEKDRFNIFGFGSRKSDDSAFYRDSIWVFGLDESTGAVLDSSLIDLADGIIWVDGGPGDDVSYGQEARASCANVYGGYFLNTMTSIAFICEDYSVLWQTKFDYTFSYNGPLYLEQLMEDIGTTGTRNNIASGRNFVYINRGDKLLKYSLTCGELIDSVAIPDGVLEGGDGILVDNCDNIFVGSNAGIFKFDEGFSLLASVETDSAVFDIDYGPDNTIIASGKDFIGSFDLSHCSILSVCVDIAVDGPIASESETICLGDSTQIAVNVTNTSCDGSGGAITWTPTTGLSDPSSYFPWASPTTTTTYIVSTSHFGCDTISPIVDSITIIVDATFSVDAGADKAICLGGSANLSATGALSYQWNNGTTLDNSTIANPIASPIVTTDYIVTGSNGSCLASDTVKVTVVPLPIAGIGVEVTINEGEATILNASGGIHYEWSPTDNLSCTDCPSPVASPKTTTTYCVRVYSDTTLSCTDTICVKVNVIESECKEIFVPSGFSPNDDGNNDVLFVETNCDIKSLTFMVFDRWGEKVFESTDIASGWDGTFKGKALNNGVYSYYTKAEFEDGGEQELKGNVSLVK